MKAHDVRHIRRCPLCNDFGDRRHVLSDGPTQNRQVLVEVSRVT